MLLTFPSILKSVGNIYMHTYWYFIIPNIDFINYVIGLMEIKST